MTTARPGKKHFIVRVQGLDGEFTLVNNTKHAYLEVVEGKLKVLIAAAAPHPDIKAFRALLETEDNMEVTVYIPGIEAFRPQEYAVAILHQLPSRLNLGQEALNYVQNKKIPALYVVGMQTSVPDFNRLSPGLTINPQGAAQTDEVAAVYNPAFNRFSLDAALQGRFRHFPPVDVPFGEYKLAPGTELVLKQQVGSVPTNKPVLALQVSPAGRQGVLVGDGVWQWRLNEFATQENTEAFDRLFLNVVQLLTVKETRKRLHVYPVQDEFKEAEEVAFEADVYNEVFQKIYGQRISLTLTHEDGSKKSFSFVNGANFSRFNVGSLKPGLYKYEAATQINGRTERDQGELIVQSQQLEALQSQADFNLLYQLAGSTGAGFFRDNQLSELTNTLLKAEFKPILYSTEKVKELINQKWLFFFLFLLLATEWFLRKYKGGY